MKKRSLSISITKVDCSLECSSGGHHRRRRFVSEQCLDECQSQVRTMESTRYSSLSKENKIFCNQGKSHEKM